MTDQNGNGDNPGLPTWAQGIPSTAMIFVEGFDGCPAEINETPVAVLRFVGSDGEGDLSEAYLSFDTQTIERLIEGLGQLSAQLTTPPEPAA